MSSPFAGLQGGGGALNKFPFLIVPVSQSAQDVVDPRNSTYNSIQLNRKPSATSVQRPSFEKCSDNASKSNPAPSTQNPASSNPGLPISIKSDNTCQRKPAQRSSRTVKRSVELQKQLNAHFSPAATYPTLLQTFSAHDQLRRPARLLYPDTEFDPNSSSTTGPEDLDSGTILYNGVKITRDSCQEILRPPPNFPQSQRFSVQNRRNLLFSANVSPEELARAIPAIAEKGGRKYRSTPNPEPEKRQICKSQLQSNEIPQPENAKVVPPLQFQVDRLVRQLRAKDVEMAKLKDELSEVKESVESSKTAITSTSCCQSLQKGLSRVEKQLEQLEEKIDGCDGDTCRRNFGPISLSRKSSIEFGIDRLDFPLRIPPDYDRIIRTARELNSMVVNNPIELCYNSGGATFKHSESVTLTMYKNGLILDVQPLVFKSFSNPSTFDFIQDIYDGYFPSELQDKYPNGITLIVDDKRSVTYTKSASGSYFTGKGVKMSETCLRPVLPRFLPGMTYKPKEPTPTAKTVSTESFKSQSSIKSESHFEELPDLMPNHLIPFHHKKMGSKNIITLKLKNIITGALYKLRTSVHATIRNLLDHLELNLDEDDSSKSEADDDDAGIIRRRFELINILPFGSFAILGSSLRDYGVTTNSLLYFRPK